MAQRSRWLLAALAFAAGSALATDGARVLRANLSGDEEVPAISTTGEIRGQIGHGRGDHHHH